MSLCHFITGGGGNLARPLVAKLIASGAKVVALDLDDGIYPELESAIYIQGDITDQDQMKAILEEHRPNQIFHMASLLSGSSEIDRQRSWDINAASSVYLMELALEFGVDRFFFPSTGGTYGSNIPDPLPEDHIQWPESFYGVTKVLSERAGFYFKQVHGLDFRCIRLPLVLSPFAPEGALSAYASRAFVAAAAGEPYVFPVNPDTGLSTVYVKDAVDGMIKLMEAPVDRILKPVYNIHSISVSAGEIGSAIKQKVPNFEYAFRPDPKVLKVVDSLSLVNIDGAARSHWGWNPKYNLEDIVEDFLADN